MSDTIRTLGFEADIAVVQALPPQAVADATPILSAAIDTRSFPRRRCLLIFQNNEVGATTHTVAASVTECDTSGGVYTAATVSGTLTPLSADGVQFASVQVNPKKPFLKVTLTGSHADVDAISGACLVFIGDAV
jgi:hypothetical protein